MMILPSRLPGARFANRARFTAFCVAALLAFVVAQAAAQGVAQDPPSAVPPAPGPEQSAPSPERSAPSQPAVPGAGAASPSPPAYSPGLVDAVGRLIESGVTSARDAIGGIGTQADTVARGAADAAGTMAKGAADAVNNASRLPTALVARGREQCRLAPNGAPDCRAAAEALCRANGLTGGKSIDFQTTEKCPVQLLASGERISTGTCTLEHFVTSALCQ